MSAVLRKRTGGGPLIINMFFLGDQLIIRGEESLDVVPPTLKRE